MSLDEMEEAWRNQPPTRLSPQQVVDQVAALKSGFVPGITVCAVAMLVGLIGWGLWVQSILIDPERTLGAAIRDLGVHGVVIVGMLYMIRQNVRWQRELRTLGEDTRRCISFSISRVDEDIRSLWREGPLFSGTVIIFSSLAEWEFARANAGSSGDWSRIILIAAALSLMWVHQYYRMRVYWVPRATELKKLLNEFNAET